MKEEVVKAMPVAGYTDQSMDKIALVNVNKYKEEEVLQLVDSLRNLEGEIDQRWVSIAKTHFEEGFMALNRAIFQPKRLIPTEAR